MICVSSVTTYPGSVTIKKGHWYHGATAQVCPPDADCTCVVWESSNESVATVDPSYGYIYARSAGTARIYATATDGSGEYDYIFVTVTDDILVDSVTVNPSYKVMTVGDSTFLHETVCPTNATNKCVLWCSSNDSVATVNPISGLVIAKGAGTATIYATAQDGSGVCGFCTVRVVPIYVQDVIVCPDTLTLDVGENACLEATVYPVNATNPNISWTSGDCTIADVDSNGCVTAKSAGTTYICANAIDGSGVCGCCEVTCNISNCVHSGTDEIGVFRSLSILSAPPADTESEAPVMLGVQFTEPQNGNYKIRFVSQIKTPNYKCVGYEIHSKFGDDAPVPHVLFSKVVYSSLIAAGETIYPDEGFNYFVVGVIENIPENTIASFKIVPYAITSSEAYVYGKTTLFSCKDVQKIDYVSFGVSDNVEYHLLCNGDNTRALRIGTGNVLELTEDLPVRSDRKSYLMKQKWILKSVGNSKKIFTQLDNSYYLCNNGSGDAYVSKSASDNNSNIVIIPCANNSEFYEIKLTNSDLYLTLEYNSSDQRYWAKWRSKNTSNSSNQIWQFVEQPANLHNGVDTASILNEATIQALKADNTEFVIRYYKILDTLKGVEMFTKGSTTYNGQTMSTIDATILKLREKGIDLDVENYLDYADTIPLNDGNLYVDGNGKSLITDEKNLYEKHNINIVSVYQNDGTQYEYFTEKHAKLDALSALMSAKTLGQPYGTTIYFAVDYDVTTNQLQRIRNYFNIIKSKIGNRYKIGVYGNGLVCSEIKPLYASYSWLAQATGKEGSESYQHYENYDNPSKYNIKQAEECSYNGFEFDDDVAVGNDYGQWYI